MPKFYVKYFLVPILFVLSLNLQAQNVDLILKVGDDLFAAKDYYGSIQFYQKALYVDSLNSNVLYKYARNLSAINSHKKSIRYYEKALLIDRGIEYPMLNYYLAEAYRSSGEYRKAKRYYSKALTPYRKDRSSYWYRRINQSKNSCSWASKNNLDKVAEPSNLGKSVNSSSSEYGSTVYQGNFYFSALIADSVEDKNRIKDKHYYSRIYAKSTSNYDEATLLEFDSNSKKLFNNMHIANPSFYDSSMYFSACDSNFKCTIWKSEISNNQISNCIKLNKNINNPSSNNTQPNLAFIDNDLYLFFVSDRARGIGGLDIWVSKQESFGFDEAINLGTTINTPDNEVTPSYDKKSKTLFFSSDWHLGFGGFDIFKSEGKPGHFEEAENLGYGINTHANELYFEPMGQGATFTSNRPEGNLYKSGSCCNDLFEVSYITEEIDTSETIVNELVLNKYLPLDLFFHNDQPDPNTRDTTTSKNYAELSNIYIKQEEEYIEKYLSILPNKERDAARAELELFFETELRDGKEELDFFTPLLLKELQKGSQVVLTIKGFASSVSETSYNLNLTLRRIQSLINYFKEYESGIFVPYLEGSSENGGKLQINKVPFGEFAVKQVLDDNDKITAVYSPQAAKERKIELVALSSTDPKSSLNTEKQASIEFDTMSIHIPEAAKGEIITRDFIISNNGESVLKLYNVSSNCECATVEYPESINNGENKTLTVSINTKGLKGKVDVQILIVSNTLNNINSLNVTLEMSH